MKKVSKHILGRVYVLMGLFLIFGVAILLRILTLQVNGDRWAQREVDQQVFFKKQVADRGNILAEDGTILATSLPFYKIALDPTVIDTTAWLNFPDSLMVLAANLATHFGGEEKDTLAYYHRVMDAMRRGDRHLYLTRQKINFKQLEMVKTWPILRWGRFEGGFIYDKFDNERFYPMGDLARVTLGKIIKDTVPIRGIEYSYNHALRGEDGYMLAQKVAGKSYVPLDQYGEELADDGYDVVTTLDVDMQDVVEKALARGVERHVAKFGTAILIEVETGKIKAIANYPESYNYAVATQIEPGSTFKTVSATAMLEDGLIELCDTIDTGDGTIMYDDKEVTDDGKVFGKTHFEYLFAKSSNVGISKAVNDRYKEDPKRYMDHLARFGLTQPVNTQLQGEPVPRIIRPEDKDWTIATLPSLSYGYSIQVTPLQMATFYNGLANNGKLVRPWVVKAVEDNGRNLEHYEPEVIRSQMCSKETAIKVRELMKSVAAYGTAAKAMKGLPFAVAGKTGTARKTKRGVGYIRKYRASFGG
ncbi:MAG: penicillin-binding protein 2, partial [Bacteroidota bacterium]